MSLTTLAGIGAAQKQRVRFIKTGAGSWSSVGWYSGWNSSGLPAAGSLAIGSTTQGVVPTASTTGAPALDAYSGTAYVANVEYMAAASSGRFMLYDRLFHCGTYAANQATATLASQPSFSSRIPGGTDYTGLQLFFETVVGGSVNQTITVTYTNDAGTAGQSTSFLTTINANVTANFTQQIPLAAGDRGIQKIETVTSNNASGCTFNLFIARPLAWGRNDFMNVVGDVWTPDRVGLPAIFSDSCLALLTAPDSAAHGTTSPHELIVDLVMG